MNTDALVKLSMLKGGSVNAAQVLFLWTYFAFGHTELYQRCRAAGVEVVAAHTHLAAVGAPDRHPRYP